jgi:hypothetical protein
MFRFAAAAAAFALTASTGFSPTRQMVPFVKYAQRSIAIVDVRMFDGTGAPVRDHRTVVVD